MRRSRGALLISSFELLQQSRAKISNPVVNRWPYLSMKEQSMLWEGDPLMFSARDAQDLSSIKNVYLN